MECLHEDFPLDTERGYQVHFKDIDHLIKSNKRALEKLKNE